MAQPEAASLMSDWLDLIGLPWRSTRAQLMAQHGVKADNPYEWPLVSIELAPAPLAGMLWPFGFQHFGNLPTAFPPLRFSTAVWLDDDARSNVRQTARDLASVLGAQLATEQFNTISAEWRFGTASLRLIGWPTDLQKWPMGPNPAQVREPRLIHACYVEINSGWRLPISVKDRHWLDDVLRAAVYVDLPRGARITPLLSAEHVLPYLRAIPDDCLALRGRIAATSTCDALVFANAGLHIVPVDHIVQVECDRLLPAKGGGGSWLKLKCGRGTSDWPFQWVGLLQAEHADDLTQFGEALAKSLDVPFALGSYEYDT